MNRINYQILKLEGLRENPNNNRSLKEDEIDALALSIKENGLIHPLVVYPSVKGYVIVSGHKRYHACKKLGMKDVPVHVLAHPKDEYVEQEMLAQSNMHRCGEDDIINEVRLVKELWASMPVSMRKAQTEKLKKIYFEKNVNGTKAEFRPMNEYVRYMTGLDISNSTISRYLREEQIEALIEAEDPVEEQEPKPKKAKKSRKIRSLNDMLEATALELSYFISGESEELLDEDTTKIINSITEQIVALLSSRKL